MGRMDLGGVAFASLALLTVGSAGFVAFTRQREHRAAVALVGTLVGAAGLYALLGADVLAVEEILVSVGGTLALVLMTSLTVARGASRARGEELPTRRRATLLSLLLFSMLLVLGLHTRWPQVVAPAAGPSTSLLGHAFVGEYLLPFELAGVVLVTALVGGLLVVRRVLRSSAQRAS